MAGFGSAAFFLWTVRIPSCGSVYAVALFSWISSCSSVGCENIRQETSAAGSLHSSVHLAAQPLHVPPSCVSALRSSVDRVRCEQVDATRREHGYYPASSLRVALLRLNTPDSTSSGPLCFEQGCMHAARGMSICRWRALEAFFGLLRPPGVLAYMHTGSITRTGSCPLTGQAPLEAYTR